MSLIPKDFIPTEEHLKDAKDYVNKTTDDYGVALRVYMLIEQAEKVRKIAYEIDNSEMSTAFENIKAIIKGTA